MSVEEIVLQNEWCEVCSYDIGSPCMSLEEIVLQDKVFRSLQFPYSLSLQGKIELRNPNAGTLHFKQRIKWIHGN